MFGLKPSYLKEGPGVTPEQAADRGAKRFFRIYFREFWPLVGLNLLFVLLCVPIFTIFPAWKALCTVTAKLVAGENVFYASEFKAAFLEHLPRTFLGGIGLAAGEIVCAIACVFYLRTLSGVAGVALAALTLSVGLFLVITAWCFYPLLVEDAKATLPQLYKRAFAYGIVGLKFHLPCLVFAAVAAFVIFLLSPWALLFVFVWVFSCIAYLNAYAMRATNALLEKRRQAQ